MQNVSHPVFGPTLRRIFRFEGPGRYTQSHMVPIHQKINDDRNGQNVVMQITKVFEVIEQSSYRILMEETVPMKEDLLDHFWGFRPKIRG